MIEASPGTVIAPRRGGAWVKLRDSTRTVFAQNTLNLRTPPYSVVLVAQEEKGRYYIVGRER